MKVRTPQHPQEARPAAEAPVVGKRTMEAATAMRVGGHVALEADVPSEALLEAFKAQASSVDVDLTPRVSPAVRYRDFVDGQKVLDAVGQPLVLFHSTDTSNRESILRSGLCTRYSRACDVSVSGGGATFFTDTCSLVSEGFDLWVVDSEGLELEEDRTTDPFGGESWYATFRDIPSDRLSLANVKSGAVEAGEIAPPIRQIDTPEFKAWFGKSKVVDERGDPLVVYHGTDKDFAAFDLALAGLHFESGGKRGAFFTQSGSAASQYAATHAGGHLGQAPIPGLFVGTSADAGRGGACVIPVYLSLQNPLVRVVRGFDSPDVWFDRNQQSLYDQADKIKADGIIVSCGQFHRDRTMYIVFDACRIKSAIGNCGTFNPSDPDIRQ